MTGPNDYDPSTDAAVVVYCDNPRHARGKVAKVETFRRIAAFGDDWLVDGERIDAPNVVTYRHPDGEPWRQYKCKLCGGGWLCNDADFTHVLDQLAHDGVSRINLQRLNVLASRKQ